MVRIVTCKLPMCDDNDIFGARHMFNSCQTNQNFHELIEIIKEHLTRCTHFNFAWLSDACQGQLVTHFSQSVNFPAQISFPLQDWLQIVLEFISSTRLQPIQWTW